MTINSFFKLNKSKIIFASKFIFLIFAGLTLTLLIFGYLTHKILDALLIVQILLIGFIGAPSALMLFIIGTSLINLRSKIKILSKIELIRSNAIKVSDTTYKENTRWFFTDIAKKIVIHDREIICFIDDLAMDSIHFRHEIHFDNKNKKAKFSEHKIKLLEEGKFMNLVFNKVYDIKEFKKFDSHKIEIELLDFVARFESQYL